MKLEVKKLNVTNGGIRITLKQIHGFIKSYMHQSRKGQELSKGKNDAQSKFLFYSALQFYYEFNVKFKNALHDFNESNGMSW